MSQETNGAVTNRNNNIASSSDYIALTKSALELITSSNPVTKLAHGIVRWLGRECIDESDFTYCLEQSRGIAYPNEHGLAIRQSILQNENKLVKVGGLHLITAGAVGRWMAFSQDHAYMVTTVAVATKYQGIDYAAQLLRDLVLHNKYGFIRQADAKLTNSFAVDRIRLMGVIAKIVESIALSVINPGHTLSDLPEELRSLCVHFTYAAAFADICSIIPRTEEDLMLLCDRFQGALLLWIMAHFEGTVEVPVAGKDRYRRSSPHSNRRLVMVVQDTCRQECHKENRKVEVLVFLGREWNHLLSREDAHKMKVSPVCRQPLYTIKPSNDSIKRDILNREELYQTKNLAQRAVLWVVDTALVPSGRDVGSVGFTTVFSSKPTDCEICKKLDVELTTRYYPIIY